MDQPHEEVHHERRKFNFKLSKNNVSLFTILGLAVVSLVTVILVGQRQDLRQRAASTIYNPIPGCSLGTSTPRGQANPSPEGEPMGAIWCFNLSVPVSPTRIAGTNSWIDDFDTNVLMQRFANGDLDYVVLDKTGAAAPAESKHWLNNNHWMADALGGFHGGMSIRPNKSFTFENGKFVVEADFAASIPEYGVNAWGEITITTAPNQTGITDDLYAYGRFAGHYVIGCRFQTDGMICAQMAPSSSSATNDGKCSADGGYRVIEMSSHQNCGTTTYTATNSPYSRDCQTNQMDIYCRDRFRMELSKNGLVVYINGVRAFEDSGWPTNKHLPDSFMNGPLYVYQSSWVWRANEGGPINGSKLHRFHWDRFTVNPKDIGDHIMPPTAAPSFCLGQPQNTCPLIFVNPEAPVPSDTSIDIVDFVFSPQKTTVQAGDTVTWTNKSTVGIIHSVESSTGVFSSQLLGSNQTFSHKFTTPGIYNYYCGPHPGMTGTITVLGEDGSTPPPATPTSVQPTATSAPTPTTDPNAVTFNVSLNSAKETPPNPSTATGYATLTLNTQANTLSYNITFSGLTSAEVGAHIHGPAAIGVGGAAIMHALPSGSPKIGTWNYTQAQEADILAGLTYINIHSSNYPNGEIRAQIVPPGGTTITPSPTTATCALTGDINCDNSVTILDLSILLSNWSSTNPSNPRADINSDGTVTIIDLSILLSNWNNQV